MRNVDKVKALETDLGRHRKKIEDQKAEIEKLKSLVETFSAGAEQTNVLVDAVMAAVRTTTPSATDWSWTTSPSTA